MTAEDHHFRREDRTVHSLRIASYIAQHPEDPAIPLANCERWLSLGRVHPAPLLEWQLLIHAAQGSPEALHTFVGLPLGENRACNQRHGYHADILRDSMLEPLPTGWRLRLVAVPGCTAAHALEPHDPAAVKLRVARPKDIALLTHLRAAGLIDAELVRSRLNFLDVFGEQIPHLHSNFRDVFQA